MKRLISDSTEMSIKRGREDRRSKGRNEGKNKLTLKKN